MTFSATFYIEVVITISSRSFKLTKMMAITNEIVNFCCILYPPFLMNTGYRYGISLWKTVIGYRKLSS